MHRAGKIRVIIVDDHRFALAGVAATVNAQPDMEVVGEAGFALLSYPAPK